MRVGPIKPHECVRAVSRAGFFIAPRLSEGVKAVARLRLRFSSEAVARAVEAALAVDNPASYVRQSRAGLVIEVQVSGPSPRSLRETLEDYLRCAVTAEQAAMSARSRRRERL